MDFISVVVLGIVEGITEFLPISSTGHMILTASLLRLPPSDFLSSFEISIQLGAILAVVLLYWKKFWQHPKEIFLKLLVAFLPTAIIGFGLYSIIKKYLLNNEIVVLWTLLVGGLVIILFERFYKEKDGAVTEIQNISYKNCVLIGLFQSLAIVPGVSRSAATILGGLSLGLKRTTIVEFSFFLAIPTMLAATGWDLIKTGTSFSSYEWLLLVVGAAVACVTAIVAIKFLLNFIQRRTFSWFGIYRVVLAILFYLIIIK